jgi:starvation-inducible DNA-binding protein
MEQAQMKTQSQKHGANRQHVYEPRPHAQTKAQSVSEEISKTNEPHSPVVMQLQRQVANAYMLYHNYKHYHWNTYGPHFRDLHLFFDELADAVLKTTDGFAERIRMIGQDPIFSPGDIIETATVKAADPANFTMRDMITEADRQLLTVIKELREAIHTADEHDDPGTADLLTDAVQVHEKHEWWLRDILETRDGLTGPKA